MNRKCILNCVIFYDDLHWSSINVKFRFTFWIHLSRIQHIWAWYKTFDPDTKHLSRIQNIWAGYKTFVSGSSYTPVSKWAANTTTKKAECTQIINNCFIYLLLHFLIQLIGEGKTFSKSEVGLFSMKINTHTPVNVKVIFT